MSKVNFGNDDAAAWGLMGYIGGISKQVQTSAYIGAALNYTHAQLSVFFDEWFDAVAKSNPSTYQHMYEWPEQYQAYDETVGHPSQRLWQHTFSGNSKTATASFKFLPSHRPTPVDPILLEEGPSGRSVKTGVHIFIWKAMAFEYGMPLKVEPTLAKMLAYVGRDKNSGGHDEGWHHATEHDSGNMVNFSKGPVHFTAGGGKTTMKFTTAYILWWQTMASDEFDTRLAQTFERDIVNQAKLDAAIRLGKSRGKAVNISAQASQDEAVFEAAQSLGIADLVTKQGEYIKRAAAARRRALYGE